METPGPWRPTDSFSRRLLLLRRELDLTVDEISAKCEIASATWSNWEAGAQPRGLDQIVAKIARATGVDRDWLMWGSADNNRAESDMSRPDLTLIIGDAKHTGGPSPLVGVVH